MSVNRRRINDLIESEATISLLVFLVALVFYVATAAPTVLWADDAGYQRTYYLMQLSFRVTSHPLWIIVAQPFRYLPFGDIAYRANLVSATFGALTLWLVYLVTRYYSKSVPSRIIAVAVLGVSHTFWAHCVRAEVYTLNTFFFTSVWLVLLKWKESEKHRWLIISALIWIVSLGNHLQMLIALPGYLYLVASGFRHYRNWRKALFVGVLLIICMFSVVMLSPFLLSIVKDVWNESMRYLWPPHINVRVIAVATIFIVYNLMFALIIALVGLKQLWVRSRDNAWIIILFVLSNCVFMLSLGKAEEYIYLMPAYVALAVACSAGFVWLMERWKKLSGFITVIIFVVLPIIIYRITPAILNELNIAPLYARDLPGRDAKTFFLWPPKIGNRGAREYGEIALNSVPQNALIFADGTPAKTLWYLQQVEGIRPDVRVVIAEPHEDNDTKFMIEKSISKKGIENWRLLGAHAPFLVEQSALWPVFLADTQLYYDMKNIQKYFDVIPFGPIYKLQPRINFLDNP